MMALPNDDDSRPMPIQSIRFYDDGQIEAIDFVEGVEPSLAELLEVVSTYHEQLSARKRHAKGSGS